MIKMNIQIVKGTPQSKYSKQKPQNQIRNGTAFIKMFLQNVCFDSKIYEISFCAQNTTESSININKTMTDHTPCSQMHK